MLAKNHIVRSIFFCSFKSVHPNIHSKKLSNLILLSLFFLSKEIKKSEAEKKICIYVSTEEVIYDVRSYIFVLLHAKEPCPELRVDNKTRYSHCNFSAKHTA